MHRSGGRMYTRNKGRMYTRMTCGRRLEKGLCVYMWPGFACADDPLTSLGQQKHKALRVPCISMHKNAQNVFNRLDLSSYLPCDSCVHEFLWFWCLSIDGQRTYCVSNMWEYCKAHLCKQPTTTSLWVFSHPCNFVSFSFQPSFVVSWTIQLECCISRARYVLIASYCILSPVV